MSRILRQSGVAIIAALSIGFFTPAIADKAIADKDEGRTSAVTRGVNHIGFTVSDLDATATFFIETLGWQDAGGDPDYPARFVADDEAFVTLWQAEDPETATPFNRKTNVGLHHMAMTVPDLETLDELYAKLQEHPGVTIEFAPEFLGDGPTTHMMIRDPSGLRLEFVVPRGRRRGDSAE